MHIGYYCERQRSRRSKKELIKNKLMKHPIAPVHPLKERIHIMREILNDANKYVNKGLLKQRYI